MPQSHLQWVWDFRPLSSRGGLGRKGVPSDIPVERGRNLQLPADTLPPAGQPLWAYHIRPDANANQRKLPPNREYYVPTPEDTALVRECCPKMAAENPSWATVEADLI